MFNRRSEVMKQFSILALCLILVLAITTSVVEGQMNVPVTQNGSHAAGNGRSHAANVHPSAPVAQNIASGPANFGPRTIHSYPTQTPGQRTVNFRPNYSQFMRPLNPTLAEMSARQTARIDNAQAIPGILARRDNEQTALPIANAQPVVKTDNLKPIRGDLARREISEGLETIDTQGIARNNNVQPIARESANRETKQRDWLHIVISCDALSVDRFQRSVEHTSELQSRFDLVCRL